jgi:transposase
LVYDGTNFHTFIASTNDKAPIAQRGHAKNRRFDLRLVGLALACSTDHRIPLAHIATAGNTPDSTRGYYRKMEWNLTPDLGL